MAKSKYLDLIPMITGIMCPFLYLLGIKGAFIMEGGIYHPWWHIVLAGFAPIGILLSGRSDSFRCWPFWSGAEKDFNGTHLLY